MADAKMQEHTGKQTIGFTSLDQWRIGSAPADHVFHIIASPCEGHQQKDQDINGYHDQVQDVFRISQHPFDKILIGIIILLLVHIPLSQIPFLSMVSIIGDGFSDCKVLRAVYPFFTYCLNITEI